MRNRRAAHENLPPDADGTLRRLKHKSRRERLKEWQAQRKQNRAVTGAVKIPFRLGGKSHWKSFEELPPPPPKQMRARYASRFRSHTNLRSRTSYTSDCDSEPRSCGRIFTESFVQDTYPSFNKGLKTSSELDLTFPEKMSDGIPEEESKENSFGITTPVASVEPSCSRFLTKEFDSAQSETSNENEEIERPDSIRSPESSDDGGEPDPTDGRDDSFLEYNIGVNNNCQKSFRVNTSTPVKQAPWTPRATPVRSCLYSDTYNLVELSRLSVQYSHLQSTPMSRRRSSIISGYTYQSGKRRPLSSRNESAVSQGESVMMKTAMSSLDDSEDVFFTPTSNAGQTSQGRSARSGRMLHFVDQADQKKDETAATDFSKSILRRKAESGKKSVRFTEEWDGAQTSQPF